MLLKNDDDGYVSPSKASHRLFSCLLEGRELFLKPEMDVAQAAVTVWGLSSHHFSGFQPEKGPAFEVCSDLSCKRALFFLFMYLFVYFSLGIFIPTADKFSRVRKPWGEVSTDLLQGSIILYLGNNAILEYTDLEGIYKDHKSNF